MKTAVAGALALLFLLQAAPASVQAQQAQGDVELQFSGSLLSTMGQEGRSFTSGMIQTKVGYFVTDRLELGAFPSFLVNRVRVGDQTATDTRFGMGIFSTYSFLAEDAVTVPYVGAQAYRIDLTDDDERGWVGGNAGLKFYISRRTAFDVGGNVLLGLGDAGGTLVLFQVGLSFLL